MGSLCIFLPVLTINGNVVLGAFGVLYRHGNGVVKGKGVEVGAGTPTDTAKVLFWTDADSVAEKQKRVLRAMDRFANILYVNES